MRGLDFYIKNDILIKVIEKNPFLSKICYFLEEEKMNKLFIRLFILATTLGVVGCSTLEGTPRETRVFQEVPRTQRVVSVAPSEKASPRLFSCSGVGPKKFGTEGQCNAALLTGECKFYEPSYFGSHNKNPVNGKTTVRVASEQNECVQMRTNNGKKWVAQKEGTFFRHRKDVNGELSTVPYARDDCGNAVYAISAPSTELPAPLLATKVVETRTPVYETTQCSQKDGAQGVYGVDQNGRPYCDYPQAKSSDYSWVPWVIGAGILAVILSSRRGGGRHNNSPPSLPPRSNPPLVQTLPPSNGGGPPQVVTLPPITQNTPPRVVTLPPNTNSTPFVQTLPPSGGAPGVSTYIPTGGAPGVVTFQAR